MLLVHDEQSQISVGGNILINTHQDNVNALDLVTLRGFDRPFAHNVHEVKPGVAASPTILLPAWMVSTPGPGPIPA